MWMNYQDMLAKLGAGSAHPGGYNATLECLKLLKDLPKMDILEVGCGTGRTATALAELGHRVTALDIRPKMIEKAKVRSRDSNNEINWLVGDACNLPLKDCSFDLIIVESVTIFTPIEQSLTEYYRVLKNNGVIYDREMISMGLTKDLRSKIQKLYNVDFVPDVNQWIKKFEDAKFKNISIEQLTIIKDDLMANKQEKIDHHQIIDEDLFLDQSFIQLTIKNSDLMFESASYLAHGIIVCRK